jgi:hypothetical protein
MERQTERQEISGSQKRYIGVTGFKTVKEVELCRDTSRGRKPSIMYGILANPKTISYPGIEGTRRPKLTDISKLLPHMPRDSIPTIHYCTQNRQVSKELASILDYDSNFNEGYRTVQLNQRLPDVREIEKLKNRYSGILTVILQLEPPDLADPKKTGKILNDYNGLVEYVIIDPSLGAGLDLDKSTSLRMMNEIKINAMPVIAGGLSGNNVAQTIAFFRSEYGENFCIDAEGQLRGRSDELIVPKMKSYLKEAHDAYK